MKDNRPIIRGLLIERPGVDNRISLFKTRRPFYMKMVEDPIVSEVSRQYWQGFVLMDFAPDDSLPEDVESIRYDNDEDILKKVKQILKENTK